MKIRNGFVSNSSSSSFVVAFSELPTSVEHLKKMMYGDLENDQDPYPEQHRQDSFSTLTIAKSVFNDIEDQKVNDKKNILEGFEGWLEGAPDLQHTLTYFDDKKKWQEEWDKYVKELDEHTSNYCNKFMEKNVGKFIYTFEYSDQDGEYGCMLEHGDIFRNVTHERISRH